jgi:hypothetical protein
VPGAFNHPKHGFVGLHVMFTAPDTQPPSPTAQATASLMRS